MATSLHNAYLLSKLGGAGDPRPIFVCAEVAAVALIEKKVYKYPERETKPAHIYDGIEVKND